MKIFLAGSGWHPIWINYDFFNFYRLESFYYISKKEIPHLKKYKSFLLDSGAFTFMSQSSNDDVNWDNYVEKYAKFINEHDVQYFFELDIDSIVGIKEVERLRSKLEFLTKKQCIPVWHKSRGIEYWNLICQTYDYVAIGGLVTKEIKSTEYNVFYNLLQLAKENNCKVHGLGFTNLKGIQRYKFDSVDSTSWLSGNRFGSVYLFNGKTMTQKKKEKGQRVKTHLVAKHNFFEWVKFSKYAQQNL